MSLGLGILNWAQIRAVSWSRLLRNTIRFKPRLYFFEPMDRTVVILEKLIVIQCIDSSHFQHLYLRFACTFFRHFRHSWAVQYLRSIAHCRLFVLMLMIYTTFWRQLVLYSPFCGVRLAWCLCKQFFLAESVENGWNMLRRRFIVFCNDPFNVTSVFKMQF